MTIRNAASMPARLSEWEARGYHGSGNVQPLIGSIAGRSAIICGNGAGVFEQAEQARAQLDQPVLFGVNDVGMYLPDMDHWVSLHQEQLFTWSLVRAMTVKTNHPYMVHSVDARQGVQAVWECLTPCFALSGYFAMQIAWIMGASRIVLCGCPGEAAPRFFEAIPRTDFAYGGGIAGREDGIRQQLMKEMSRVEGFKDAVRSISGGMTQDYFGGL